MALYPFHLLQKRCYNESIITFDNIIDEATPYDPLFLIGFIQNYPDRYQTSMTSVRPHHSWYNRLMKRQKKTTNSKPSLIRPRIYLGPELMIGPGKIALLKAVRETGSISAAARQMGMNYKRAWYLLDTLKQGFRQPVVEAVQGGRGGGGTRLTALGETLIVSYEAIEDACNKAAAPHVAGMVALTTSPSMHTP
jgi:molybdate transport system regulatory protein